VHRWCGINCSGLGVSADPRWVAEGSRRRIFCGGQQEK
jgi:hypothetical protein